MAAIRVRSECVSCLLASNSLSRSLMRPLCFCYSATSAAMVSLKMLKSTLISESVLARTTPFVAAAIVRVRLFEFFRLLEIAPGQCARAKNTKRTF
jgi:hypothetical protein